MSSQAEPTLASTHGSAPLTSPAVRRGPALITALTAAAGGAVIYLLAQPALWRMSWLYGVVFAALGLAELGAAAAVPARPSRKRVLSAAAAALAVVGLWVLVRVAAVLPAPDPWVPVNSVIGITGDICAALQSLAVVLLGVLAALGQRPRRSVGRRVLGWLGLAPVAVLVLLSLVVGMIAASDGFAGAGFPAGTVAAQNLPAGRLSTVEYCRPGRVPLAMDLYTPPAAGRTGRPAPVAMYMHGGGFLGDRKTRGAGATLANHDGALFTPLRRRLNTRGFVVASIDYRLPPATPWPAQIEDTKCAVRFLRAHARQLGIDPARIGVWGSSGGGQLASLLGLAGQNAGFDRGQYLQQSSAVQAVVDMFGPADLTHFGDSSPFGRVTAHIAFGGSTAVRRTASPDTYVAPGAPPFLILQGSEDPLVSPGQSAGLAQRLRAAGVPTTLIPVIGAAHGFTNNPDQHPSAAELTTTVTDFLTTTLQ
jgi:acetyl esterase/lipase